MTKSEALQRLQEIADTIGGKPITPNDKLEIMDILNTLQATEALYKVLCCKHEARPALIEFYKDTRRYLELGSRSIDIPSWNTILRNLDHKQNTPVRSELVSYPLGEQDLIMSWLSRKDGLSDIICTLNLLVQINVCDFKG